MCQVNVETVDHEYGVAPRVVSCVLDTRRWHLRRTFYLDHLCDLQNFRNAFQYQNSQTFLFIF